MSRTEIADPPSTWGDMEAAMRHRYRNNNERIGQAYFNALAAAWPEVAELVRGTDADPFYAENHWDPRMDKFYTAIMPYFQ